MTTSLAAGFDLLEEASAPNPFISAFQDLFENLGDDDFGSFSFDQNTSIGFETTPDSSILDFTQLTAFGGSITFGAFQSIGLGGMLDASDDVEDPTIFGDGFGGATINFNLVDMREITIEFPNNDPESLDIGSSSETNLFDEPEEETDLS